MAQTKDSGDETEDCIAVMKDGFLRDSFGLPFVLSVSDILTEALKRHVSEARWFQVKAHIFDMVVAWQKEKEQQSAPQEHLVQSGQDTANRPVKIRWHTDPAELGLNIPWNEEDIPWQEREPWGTIKTSAARHDRHPRKGKKSRMANWFPFGLRCRKSSGSGNQGIWTDGRVGVVALLGWACGQIRRR